MKLPISESDRFCAAEFRRLLEQKPGKYALGGMAFALLPFVDRRIGRIARTSYTFFRHIDDVIDGDLEISDSETYVASIRNAFETGDFTNGPPVIRVGETLLDTLQRSQGDEDEVRHIILDAIDVMLFDKKRGQQRTILPQDELIQHLICANSISLRIVLQTVDSSLNLKDVEGVSYTEGIAYSIRDFFTDWHRGVINVPREVLVEAHMSAESDPHDVFTHPLVRKWFLDQLQISRNLITVADRNITRSGEPMTRLTAGAFSIAAKRGIKAAQKTLRS